MCEVSPFELPESTGIHSIEDSQGWCGPCMDQYHLEAAGLCAARAACCSVGVWLPVHNGNHCDTVTDVTDPSGQNSMCARASVDEEGKHCEHGLRLMNFASVDARC